MTKLLYELYQLSSMALLYQEMLHVIVIIALFVKSWHLFGNPLSISNFLTNNIFMFMWVLSTEVVEG